MPRISGTKRWLNPAIAGSAADCVAYSCVVNGDFGRAVEFGDKAIRSSQRVNAGYVTVWGHFLAGIAELELACPASAKAHGDRAGRVAEQTLERRSFSRSMAALLSAEVASFRGEFDAAQELMEVGRTFAFLFGPVEPLQFA